MGDYIVQDPNGNQHQVSAPDGADDGSIIGFVHSVLNNIGDKVSSAWDATYPARVQVGALMSGDAQTAWQVQKDRMAALTPEDVTNAMMGYGVDAAGGGLVGAVKGAGKAEDALLAGVNSIAPGIHEGGIAVDSLKLQKFQKLSQSIEQKIANGLPLNSNERYLIANKDSLESELGAKFTIPDQAYAIADMQNAAAKSEYQAQKKLADAAMAQKKLEYQAQKIRIENLHVNNMQILRDSINNGDTEGAARAALQRAKDKGYWHTDDESKFHIDDNSTPVSYRAGAAMAELKKAGYSFDDLTPYIGNDESFYIMANNGDRQVKVRISDHGNITAAHATPDINIAPGKDVVSDISALLHEGEE